MHYEDYDFEDLNKHQLTKHIRNAEVSKNDEFCMQNEEVCIKNDEFCRRTRGRRRSVKFGAGDLCIKP